MKTLKVETSHSNLLLAIYMIAHNVPVQMNVYNSRSIVYPYTWMELCTYVQYIIMCAFCLLDCCAVSKEIAVG